MASKVPPPPLGRPPRQPKEGFDPRELDALPANPKAPPRGFEGLVAPKAPPATVASQPGAQSFRLDVDDESEPEVVSGERQQGRLQQYRHEHLDPPVWQPPCPAPAHVQSPPVQFMQPVFGIVRPPPARFDPWNPANPPGEPSWFQWNAHLEMWYCKLCNANADDNHLASSKHRKRSEWPDYFLPHTGASTPFGVQLLPALTDIDPGASEASGCVGCPPRPPASTPAPWCTSAVSSTAAAAAPTGLPAPPSCPPPCATSISCSAAATTTPGRQWPPSPPSCPPPWATSKSSSAAATVLEAAPQSIAPVAPPVVPADWKTMWDPDAEKFYYWQPSTNLVQWDHPKAADLKLPVPEQQRQQQEWVQ